MSHGLSDQTRVAADELATLLSSLQNSDGGWGARRGAISNAENTALACLALGAAGPEPPSAVLRGAIDWLLHEQTESGAWSFSSETPFAPWPTAMALLSLLEVPSAAAAVERGYAWLLDVRGVNFGWRAWLRELLGRGDEVTDLDDRLEGWPWIPGTFSWVEPTSWALAALKARWPERPPRAVRRRVREGEDMLIDRTCVGGGWNYGNRTVYGAELPPYPDTTAVGLMGLRGRKDPAVDASLDTLDRLLSDENASTLSLALGVLGQRAWRRPTDALQRRLADRALDGTPAIRSLALASIALGPPVSWLGETSHD